MGSTVWANVSVIGSTAEIDKVTFVLSSIGEFSILDRQGLSASNAGIDATKSSVDLLGRR